MTREDVTTIRCMIQNGASTEMLSILSDAIKVESAILDADNKCYRRVARDLSPACNQLWKQVIESIPE